MDKNKTAFSIIAAITIVLAISVSNNAIGKSPMQSGLFVLSDFDAQDLDKYFEDRQLKPEFIDQINENSDQIPDFVIEALAQGKTNVTVVADDGEKKDFTVEIKDNQLVQAEQGNAPDADAAIEVSENTIKKIANSEQPVQTFTTAINSGEIKYTALTSNAKPKELLVAILAFFSGIINSVFSFFTTIFGR